MTTEDRAKTGWYKPDWHRFAGPAVILLAAFVAVAPQFIRGNSCGHDFNIHLVSWFDCLNAWRHGILYPHWTPSANYGAGEPRFVFYPPLTWMLGAALGAVFPWAFAPIAFTFLCLAATGLATRALALEAFNDGAATLAGCVSIFSGYALFTAYERTAFPELTGGFWLPLLLLFALRNRNASARLLRRAFDGSTVPLALVLVGAWLSNAPLGVIASYLLAAVALLAALLYKSWAPALRATLAAALGLSAIYLLPAALERRWVDIHQATDDPGSQFENNWLFARHASPALALHDVVLRQASIIAVTMIAVALASLVVSWLRGTFSTMKSSVSRYWFVPLATIPIAVLILLLPISGPVWRFFPEMSFLQFPWRWLEAVEAPMAIVFAAAVWPAGRRARIAILAACAAAFLAATALAATQFFQFCYPEDTVASSLAAYRSGAGFEGMSEYEPPGADDSQIATGLPDACLVSDPSTVLGKPDPDDPDSNPAWSADQPGCQATFAYAGNGQPNPEHLRMRAADSQPGYVVLRLLSFPAWTVQVNGRLLTGERFTALPKRADGLIAIPVPRGYVDIAVDWITTPDVTASRWLSALSVLLLTGLLFVERRPIRARLK